MANLHSRRIRGNLAFWDTHQKRLVDAIGPDVIKYICGPETVGAAGGTASDPIKWVTTVVEVGTGTSEATASATIGYTWDLVTAANDNDGITIQQTGSSFEFTSDQDVYCGFELEINDVTQSDFFLGLAVTDTAILGGVTDRIGFQSVDTEATIKFTMEKDSTETLTASLGTIVDDTLVFAEFYWDGTGVEVFIDGVSAATPAVTNLPNDLGLRFSMEFLTGEAVAQTMSIRQARVIQIGR